MNDPIFDPPDADDTIRRPLPSGLHNEPNSSAFSAKGSRPRLEGDPVGFVPQKSGYIDEGFDDDVFANDFGLAVSAGEQRQTQRDSTIDNAFDLAAINPLVGAAAPLLWLAGRLNESAPPEDISQFRERIVQEIKRFETAAMTRDVPSRLVRMARYALAATIDDIILNTDWGGQRAWASHSLVSLLYNETWGGERFYDLLSQMRLNVEDNIDGLEFMAICLAVGFCGKYRVMEGGHGQVSRLRHELYRTIRRVKGPYERDLSPPWEAVAAPYAAPKSARAAWIVAAFACLLVAALWIASSINLRARVETAAEQIDALAPKMPVAVKQPVIPAIPEPHKPAEKTQMERLSGFLAQDIAAGTVEVTKQSDRIAIRLLKASFPSGGAVLDTSEEPLISRIGAALDGEKGPILVVGHTDNVPVPSGSSLGDNMAISRARAQSAADVLRRHVKDPGRISSEGRGSNDPIAANTTPEGRSRNRRVDFWINAEEEH